MDELLRTSIKFLAGVGPKRAEMLKKEIDVESFDDLLNYYPYRYVDRSKFYRTNELLPDMPYVQLKGYIRHYYEEGNGRQKRLKAIFSDEYGSIELIWFAGYRYIQQMFPEGRQYIIFGKPSYYLNSFNMPHPEIDTEETASMVSGGLVPMYHTTETMKRSGITSRKIQELVYKLLKSTRGKIEETLPEYIIKHYGLPALPDAIRMIHYPQNPEELRLAKYRLKFEELFYLELKLELSKEGRKTRFLGEKFAVVGDYFNSFYLNHLPFDLTNAQKRVVKEIRTDCGSGCQMNRLVQGDVGSGKTMVALLAMLLALDNGCQACMMAPTEILARQHHEGLSELLKPMGIEVGLLIGSTTKKQREKLLPKLASGELKIIVGTHALIEPNIIFHRLGMAVIDEQHRFGVEQRAKLWIKNPNKLPHVLIMSATPIPRTLAMTLYGDLDISIIDELPPGRKPVYTEHRFDDNMHPIFMFLHREIKKGRQVYVVFPMIEETEKADIKSLEEGYDLYASNFGQERVTLVHGKMNAREKKRVMDTFVSGEKKILLATTVIEVGVNVPNASVMIIENADRFGLSQLHQLRGRVGRGAEQSYCILLTSSKVGNEARKRIEVMCSTNDGFIVAEEDMKQRGFGEIEGTRQSGKELMLKIANPASDGQLVAITKREAASIVAMDPSLTLEHNVVLKERLLWLDRNGQEAYSNIS